MCGKGWGKYRSSVQIRWVAHLQNKNMNKKTVIFLAISLAVPNVVFACASTVYSTLFTMVLFYIFLFFLLTIIIISIKRKKIYRGKINIILIVIFSLFVAKFGYAIYMNHKEFKECQKNCTKEIPCFCNNRLCL